MGVVCARCWGWGLCVQGVVDGSCCVQGVVDGGCVCKVLGIGVAVQHRSANHTDCILQDTLTGNDWAVCGAVLSPP